MKVVVFVGDAKASIGSKAKNQEKSRIVTGVGKNKELIEAIFNQTVYSSL